MVQAEVDNKSFNDITLPNYAEWLTMLGYEHDLEDRCDHLNVGHYNAEEAEGELWAKGTKVGQ